MIKNNLKTILKENRITSLFPKLDSKIDEIYSLSFTSRLILNIITWFKVVFRNSILGRLSEINEYEEKGFFSESIAVKKTQENVNFLMNKLSRSCEESKLINTIEKSKTQFKNISTRRLGSIMVIAIVVNVIINILFKDDISYFGLIVKTGFFLSGIFLILCNSDLNTIIINSFFYRRLSKIKN